MKCFGGLIYSFIYCFSEADKKNNKKKSGEKKLIGVVRAEFNIYMY